MTFIPRHDLGSSSGFHSYTSEDAFESNLQSKMTTLYHIITTQVVSKVNGINENLHQMEN